MDIKILPSVLNVPREDIPGYIEEIEQIVDGISFDIMDGVFVPPTSFTLEEVESCTVTKLMEVHLMVQHPEMMIEDYIKAGADIVTIHYESDQPSVIETLEMIKDLGAETSLALKPATPVDNVSAEIWDMVDIPLIMSVEPGWGGQSFMHDMLDKVSTLRERYPEKDINIDGGITADTAPLAIAAGATILVSGSYLYKAEDRVEAVRLLKGGR